jgi:hypothetical protein
MRIGFRLGCRKAALVIQEAPLARSVLNEECVDPRRCHAHDGVDSRDQAVVLGFTFPTLSRILKNSVLLQGHRDASWDQSGALRPIVLSSMPEIASAISVFPDRGTRTKVVRLLVIS